MNAIMHAIMQCTWPTLLDCMMSWVHSVVKYWTSVGLPLQRSKTPTGSSVFSFPDVISLWQKELKALWKFLTHKYTHKRYFIDREEMSWVLQTLAHSDVGNGYKRLGHLLITVITDMIINAFSSPKSCASTSLLPASYLCKWLTTRLVSGINQLLFSPSSIPLSHSSSCHHSVGKQNYCVFFSSWQSWLYFS